MLETALSAFAILFATFSRAERVAISLKATGTAAGIILFFAIFGAVGARRWLPGAVGGPDHPLHHRARHDLRQIGGSTMRAELS
jgi:hypothetical protein